ncbi:hypothetical protein GCM10011575_16870 [Microlunatus endophyticus]|uniref:Uncharacterized protein n=1 Tax=Microlunatus endophyticus TaxID=1716077 RepID=A0A917S690_9ACTN|nr:hypothetical protein [Microlunatus endophyticus]GGL59010.1 hypothetical protein GCM10011575_16870 [Microlunatus endophyticus]
MAGVMHPVGPESPETYWRRRALVVGVFLVLLIILLVVLFNLGGSPGQAAPTGSQSVIPADAPTSASDRPTPSPTASSPAASTPSPTPSPTSRHPTATPTSSSSGKSSSTPSSKPSTHPSKTPVAVTACTSSDLKATLTSKAHHVGIGDKVGFDVSYVNKSDQSCKITIGAASFELKITSGTDRIWSTADCAKLVPSKKTALKPGHGVGWTITWNGKRSLAGATCKNRPETPGAGYYHATADLDGAQAPDYVLVLK